MLTLIFKSIFTFTYLHDLPGNRTVLSICVPVNCCGSISGVTFELLHSIFPQVILSTKINRIQLNINKITCGKSNINNNNNNTNSCCKQGNIQNKQNIRRNENNKAVRLLAMNNDGTPGVWVYIVHFFLEVHKVNYIIVKLILWPTCKLQMIDNMYLATLKQMSICIM